MTNNQITVAAERLRNYVAPAKLNALRETMRDADDGCMDAVMTMPLKSRGVALALAILLGSFGADRFYVGDKGLAIGRLIASIVSGFLMLVPVLGFIVRIGMLIWHIVNCVFVYRRAAEKNYIELSGYLVAHKKAKAA